VEPGKDGVADHLVNVSATCGNDADLKADDPVEEVDDFAGRPLFSEAGEPGAARPRAPSAVVALEKSAVKARVFGHSGASGPKWTKMAFGSDRELLYNLQCTRLRICKRFSGIASFSSELRPLRHGLEPELAGYLIVGGPADDTMLKESQPACLRNKRSVKSRDSAPRRPT
jgi:hypothetical protein